MPLPPEGRLLQVTAEGAVLVAAVADDLGRTQDAIPFTCAFRSLHVDPVLDPGAPFGPYYPGVPYAYQHRSLYGDSQQAETSED